MHIERRSTQALCPGDVQMAPKQRRAAQRHLPLRRGPAMATASVAITHAQKDLTQMLPARYKTAPALQHHLAVPRQVNSDIKPSSPKVEDDINPHKKNMIFPGVLLILAKKGESSNARRLQNG